MFTRASHFIQILSFTSILVASSPAFAQPRYTVQILSYPEGRVFARDLNNRGQVVGRLQLHDGWRPFLYDNNVLNLVPGISSFSEAVAINDLGQITGTYQREEDRKSRAFIFSGGSLTTLGSIGDENFNSWGSDINNAGEVVGEFGFNRDYGFIFTDGQMQGLPALSGIRSSPQGINNQGRVVAQAGLQAITTSLQGPVIDLGALSRRGSYATGINDSGEVAGYSWHDNAPNTTRAVLVQNGGMIDIGTFRGANWAHGINNAGQVVGATMLQPVQIGQSSRHATLYSGGVTHDLNDWVEPTADLPYLNEAIRINEHGQILGMNPIWPSPEKSWLLTPNYRVSVTPRDAAPGDTITVGWTVNGTRPATDWIGLYYPGSHNERFVWWAYTGGSSVGELVLTAPDVPGTYEFRYFIENSFRDMGLSGPLTVAQPGYSLTPDAITAFPGKTIKAYWTAAAQSNPKDWIGIYRAGADNLNYISWAYTGGTLSGSLPFTAPLEDGLYELRYLSNDGFVDVARSVRFQVTSSAHSLTVLRGFDGRYLAGGRPLQGVPAQIGSGYSAKAKPTIVNTSLLSGSSQVVS